MPPKSVDALLREVPATVRPIAVALRKTVRASAPELEEIVNYGMPCYVEPGQRWTVVYVSAAKDHVNLGFYDGVDLKDPRKKLVGTGKRLRHVKVRSVAEAGDRALSELIREAVRYRHSARRPERRPR